jgi:hypothetical protein
MILNSPYISGSSTITGNLNVLGTITGSTNSAISASYALNATSASYALNATSASFATNTTTSSFALIATSASYSNNSTSASYAANSDLLDGRDSTTFANTGSNAFVGTQNINGSVAITGSLTTTGTITAQTLNVQQVTSSIVYSSGSNIFGNSVSNTQSMTGSVGISGSLVVAGALTGTSATFSDVVSSAYASTNTADPTGGVFYSLQNTSNTNNNWSTIKFRDAQGNDAGYIGVQHVDHTNNQGDVVILARPSGGNVTEVARFLGTGATTLSGALTGTSATFTGTLIQQNITDGTNLIGLNTSNSVRQFNLFSTTTYSAFGTATNNPLLISTNDTERMRITSGGNVGIGTASPTQLLQVGGNAASMAIGDGLTTNGTSRLKFTSSNSVTNWQISNNDSIAGAFEIMPSTAAGGKTFTTPAFSIASTGAATFSSTVNAHTFTATSTLNASVAVSLSNPGVDGISDGPYFRYLNTTNSYQILKQINANTDEDTWSIRGGSWVKIGTLNAVTGAYTALSDINKKKDFELSTIGLNAILGLKPTLYRMLDEENTDKNLGFIAQEVKEFIPQAYVENGGDDYKFIGLNYNAIVAALVKGMQEQQAQIEALKLLIK